MTTKKFVAILTAIVVLSLVGNISPVAAQTVSSSSTSVEELQKQIQTLLNQMASLQKEITLLKSGAPTKTTPTSPTIVPTEISEPSSEVELDESEITEEETEFIPPPTLTRSLARGSRGEDVRQLQEFLAQDASIYPEGIVTGYYGVGTETAVKRWQAKNGVPSVGIVGRQTISKFKEIYSGIPVSQERTISETGEMGPTTRTKPTTSCPVYGYMPICKENQSQYDQKGCRVCQIKTTTAKEICPALATVESCPTGEEKVVTFKSEQCGVFYSCKPSEITQASNTVATLKKTSSIQTDNRYTLILNDPDGIQRFTVVNAKGGEIQSGYPACRKDWTTPTFTVDSAGFPPKLTLNDCGNPSSQYTTTLSNPVVVRQMEGLSFPYTFTDGKIVNSHSEASSYCYANGPGAGRGIAAECETKFGIVYQQVTPVSSVGSSGRAIYSSGAFESCMTRYGFKAEAGQIKSLAQLPDPIPWSVLSSGAQNAVTTCEKEYYGQGAVETGAAMCGDGKDNDGDGFIDSADSSCGAGYVVAPPSGQKEQIWNSLGLKSWIKADADSSKIAQLKQSCAAVPANSNIWMPNAGVSTSADFGMPDATKCQRASSCTASQYFDGSACMASTTTTTSATGLTVPYTFTSTGYRAETRLAAEDYCRGQAPGTGSPGTVLYNSAQQECQRIGLTWGGGGYVTTTTGSCDNALTVLLGTGCHYMYNDSASNQIYCDGPMTKSAKRGDSTSTTGCTSPSTTTAWPTDQTSCTNKGYKWCTSSSSIGWCQSSACPAGDYSYYAGDANSCPSFSYSRWDSSNRRYCQLNSEQRCDYNYPSYLTNGANYTAANCPATTSTGSGTSTWCSPLGSGWTVYGNYCLNSSRTQYAPLNSPSWSSVQSCTGADSPVTGCTPPGGGTSWPSGADTCSQYGSGWHIMGDGNCYDSGMTNYRATNGTLYSCSATPSSGCSSGTAMTGSVSTSCGSGYYWNGSTCVSSSSATGSSCSSGQYWNGTACVTSTYSSDPATACAQAGGSWNTSSSYCQMPTSSTSGSSSCSSGQYWNGTACVTSTTSSNCSTPSNCYDSSVCASSGWYWYNSGCWSSPQSSQSSGTTNSGTCGSGYYWNGSTCVTSTTSSSSTACASDQYWNGSSCVASTSSGSTTSCPSGNYWNGTACVPSTAPSASVYDQMRNQLKSMEIILRGLMGR